MKTLRIEDRKSTTQKGIDALDSLFDSLTFADDVDTVTGPEFAIKADIGDNNVFWSDRGRVRINNGRVSIFALDSDHSYGHMEPIYTPWNIQKIDFAGIIESLMGAVSQYNSLCKEKDAEIETFLTFCAAYKDQR